MKSLDDQIVTKQQEAGLEEYRRRIREYDLEMDFWRWYWFWCCEEGLFQDSQYNNRD